MINHINPRYYQTNFKQKEKQFKTSNTMHVCMYACMCVSVRACLRACIIQATLGTHWPATLAQEAANLPDCPAKTYPKTPSYSHDG